MHCLVTIGSEITFSFNINFIDHSTKLQVKFAPPQAKKFICKVNPTISLGMTDETSELFIHFIYKNTTRWRHLGKRLQTNLKCIIYTLKICGFKTP